MQCVIKTMINFICDLHHSLSATSPNSGLVVRFTSRNIWVLPNTFNGLATEGRDSQSSLTVNFQLEYLLEKKNSYLVPHPDLFGQNFQSKGLGICIFNH
jgi:hypothetical protein